jgi:hypothetical protein
MTGWYANKQNLRWWLICKQANPKVTMQITGWWDHHWVYKLRPEPKTSLASSLIRDHTVRVRPESLTWRQPPLVSVPLLPMTTGCHQWTVKLDLHWKAAVRIPWGTDVPPSLAEKTLHGEQDLGEGLSNSWLARVVETGIRIHRKVPCEFVWLKTLFSEIRVSWVLSLCTQLNQ